MTISFEIPDAVEKSLRAKLADLDRAAKEAALIELYRQEKLTHQELAQALGLDRIATDALLKQHNVTEDLPSTSELSEDLRRLRELTSK